MNKNFHLKAGVFILIFSLLLPAVSEARTAFITIKNRTDGVIRVYTNGRIRGFVRPKATRRFPVKPGSVKVKIVDRFGKTFTRTFVVTPGRRTAVWVFTYPPNILREIMKMARKHRPQEAHLFIENRGGNSVSIYVNGRFQTAVQPYDSVEIRVPAGRVKVEARAGRRHVTRVFRLRPGEFEEWSVYLPEVKRTGKISIRNNADVPLEVFVNDNYRGTVEPGEVKIIITRSGSVTVTLSDGVTERSRTFRVRPGESVSWRVRAEDFGTPPYITVVNALPDPADVYINGHRKGTLEPGEEREFELKNGSNTIELKTDAASQTLKIRARSGDTLRWEPRVEY